MHPLNNNPHLIDRFAHERYNDRRREADAWRLARQAQSGAEGHSASANSLRERALLTLRCRFSGAQRQQIAGCS